MGSLVAWMESSVRLAGSSGPGPMLSSRWDYELAFCCLGTMSVHGISCLGEATGLGESHTLRFLVRFSRRAA